MYCAKVLAFVHAICKTHLQLLICGWVFSLADDLNLAYHSLLPLEIHGANYATMRLVSKQGYIPQMVS